MHPKQNSQLCLINYFQEAPEKMGNKQFNLLIIIFWTYLRLFKLKYEKIVYFTEFRRNDQKYEKIVYFTKFRRNDQIINPVFF